MRLKRALSQIKPNEGQREKIYSDILDKLERPLEETSGAGKETRFVMKKRNIIMSAAACAVVLIGGLTVTAANFGWGHKLFGNTSSLVESNMDDYKLKVGDVKIENAEGVPYKFTLGDVISDGYSLYINLIVENIEVEEPDAYKNDVIYSNQFDYFEASPVNGYEHRMRDSMWKILDATENTVNSAIITRFGKKIEKGDVFEFELRDDGRRLDLLNHIDSAENARALLATLSFEVKNDVKDLRKSFNVNQIAIFKDRWPWSPDWGGEAPNEDKLTKLEMYVETVDISPLGFEANGTMDFSQTTNSNAFASWGNVWLIYKNGDRVSVTPNGAHYENKGDCYEVLFYGDFSSSKGGVYKKAVIDLNEIEAIEFDGFTVPLNSGETDNTEEIPE